MTKIIATIKKITLKIVLMFEEEAGLEMKTAYLRYKKNIL
jgi:hypothetical protein